MDVPCQLSTKRFSQNGLFHQIDAFQHFFSRFFDLLSLAKEIVKDADDFLLLVERRIGKRQLI